MVLSYFNSKIATGFKEWEALGADANLHFHLRDLLWSTMMWMPNLATAMGSGKGSRAFLLLLDFRTEDRHPLVHGDRLSTALDSGQSQRQGREHK